ncbi:MAG: cell wall metabolism sensor histidine kinase WalK, partial [Candidatus Omnitrophica bacterium]|nr:cell wall metabolism sensor histidine kinase WalK [Candidatus Omnitrophota bacterium]
AKDDLDKIFKEFYRTAHSKSIAGTGLGLSLVKRIIDSHGERIWVESELNNGTTFYFTLKLVKHE